MTRQVRARVNWTQTAPLRRLEFVLRPFTTAGWDADMISAELHSWMLTWRPARPAEYIRAQLAKRAAVEHQAAQLEAAEGWNEDEASGTLRVSRPALVADVLTGVAQGMAAYSAHQAANGLDNLLDDDDASATASAPRCGDGPERRSDRDFHRGDDSLRPVRKSAGCCLLR
ncbi:hypothetical protein ACIP88_35045 [Streptomyces uncialis]|uniref:hypothetical protein n=1 Tax=Streptomyces uncialis TaxID=1048205 RepID=UPI00380EA19C